MFGRVLERVRHAEAVVDMRRERWAWSGGGETGRGPWRRVRALTPKTEHIQGGKSAEEVHLITITTIYTRAHTHSHTPAGCRRRPASSRGTGSPAQAQRSVQRVEKGGRDGRQRASQEGLKAVLGTCRRPPLRSASLHTHSARERALTWRKTGSSSGLRSNTGCRETATSRTACRRMHGRDGMRVGWGQTRANGQAWGGCACNGWSASHSPSLVGPPAAPHLLTRLPYTHPHP